MGASTYSCHHTTYHILSHNTHLGQSHNTCHHGICHNCDGTCLSHHSSKDHNLVCSSSPYFCHLYEPHHKDEFCHPKEEDCRTHKVICFFIYSLIYLWAFCGSDGHHLYTQWIHHLKNDTVNWNAFQGPETSRLW